MAPVLSAARRGGVQVLSFDLDDTLYDNKPVLERAERVLQDWLAARYPRLAAAFDVAALRELRRRYFAAHPQLRHDLSALRKLALAEAARRAGYSEDLVEPAFRVFLEARCRVELYPDTRPTLYALHTHYPLAVVTNGNADVRCMGLGDLFDFVVSAEAVGAAKPDPSIFQALLERVGAPPHQVVHVGDDAVRDVLGAARAGLRTVWVNRGGSPWPGERRPDAEVRSLAELPSVLSAMA